MIGEDFVERDVDAVDLVAVMRTLADVGFDSIVVPDHVPGDGRVDEAYTFGYIRALIQAVS